MFRSGSLVIQYFTFDIGYFNMQFNLLLRHELRNSQLTSRPSRPGIPFPSGLYLPAIVLQINPPFDMLRVNLLKGPSLLFRTIRESPRTSKIIGGSPRAPNIHGGSPLGRPPVGPSLFFNIFNPLVMINYFFSPENVRVMIRVPVTGSCLEVPVFLTTPKFYL